jgi:hypothetical protein
MVDPRTGPVDGWTGQTPLRGRAREFPLLGEPGFVEAITAAVDAGDITTAEGLELHDLHEGIAKALALGGDV